ncbi:MAG TPA: hypothetical protein VGP55_15005 [Chitinophagaceae bacterium]|nr:hypothetical protein [Chitinophagaceae bacterium]
MSEDQFEEFFRNKLGNYLSAVPQDMWQRIQQKKDNDRKGFFFKWLFPLIIILVLLSSYFIFNATKNADNKKSLSSNKQNIEKQKTSNGTSDIKEIAKQTSHQNLADTKTKSDRILSNKNIGDNKRIENDFNSDSHQNKRTKLRRSIKSSLITSINNASASSINDSTTNENIIVRNPDTTNNTKQVAISSTKDSLLKKILLPNKKETKLSPTKNKNWLLEIYASPDIPFFEITARNASIVEYINRTHKIQTSFTVGVRVSRSFAEYFSIKTGFQYSRINEKFPDSGFIKNVNRYRSIDIPIFIGYDITNVNIKTTLNVGLIFNLYSWYKGRTIDTIGTVDINAPNIFKHNTGISLYAGVSLAKSISNKLQIFAEPYFSYRLSYMTKPRAPFKQKINIAGLSFGLKYNF